MARDLTDPRLIATLADAFPSTATIGEAYASQDTYGAESLLWSNAAFIRDDAGSYIVDDFGDLVVESEDDTIACCLYRVSGQEVRRPDQTVTVATHRAILAGYRSDITAEHRATIAGQIYDILAVEQDSQQLATRLLLEVIS